jgi:glycosyltransferase involved in cell wall biosynthesis
MNPSEMKRKRTMNRPPLVSVIIPTYNRASLLSRAIDSVLAQTYANVEIVVVDDGSTDHTQTVLGGYRDRIRSIRTENRGASHARNVGMRASVGKYLAFLDSDDTYYPYKLSLQVDFMERHPAIGMVSSDFSGVLNDGTVLENHLKQYHTTYEAMQWGFEDVYEEREDIFFGELGRTVACYTGDIFDLVVRNSLVMSNTILIRREVLDVVGYQNEAYRIAQDYDYVVRICKRFRVALIDIPTYRLYYHDGQLSRFVTKKIYGGARDDLSKIEYFQDVLGAVVSLRTTMLNIMRDTGEKSMPAWPICTRRSGISGADTAISEKEGNACGSPMRSRDRGPPC